MGPLGYRAGLPGRVRGGVSVRGVVAWAGAFAFVMDLAFGFAAEAGRKAGTGLAGGWGALAFAVPPPAGTPRTDLEGDDDGIFPIFAAILGSAAGSPVEILDAALPALFGGTARAATVLRCAVTTSGVIGFVFFTALGEDRVAGSSTAMSNPNSADISSSTSTLAASGRVLDSGRALSRFATSAR